MIYVTKAQKAPRPDRGNGLRQHSINSAILAICFAFFANESSVQAAVSNVVPTAFNAQNCTITKEPLPSSASLAHLYTRYRFSLTKETSTHRWNGLGVGFHVQGDCKKHVVWGSGEVIGFDNGQFVNFYRDYPTGEFLPPGFLPFIGSADLNTAPDFRRQTAVYLSDSGDTSIGVWHAGQRWIVRSMQSAKTQNATSIEALLTSRLPIISAMPHPIHHSRSYDLSFVQQQPDGSRIVFTFRFQAKLAPQ